MTLRSCMVSSSTTGENHLITWRISPCVHTGIFLHILADTLGSVGVIISSFFIHMFGMCVTSCAGIPFQWLSSCPSSPGWMLADPICSMFIAALIMLSVYPLITTSLGILMQRTPSLLDHALPGTLQKVGVSTPPPQ